MMDYTRYILEYQHEHKISSKKVLLIFLNYVQSRNIPVGNWKPEFLEHEQVILKDYKKGTQRQYAQEILKFITWVQEHDEGEQPSIFRSKSAIAYMVGKKPRERPRRKKTRIVSHWSEL